MDQHAQLKVTLRLPITSAMHKARGGAAATRTPTELRSYFPKGADLARHRPLELAANSQWSSVEASHRALLLAT